MRTLSLLLTRRPAAGYRVPLYVYTTSDFSEVRVAHATLTEAERKENLDVRLRFLSVLLCHEGFDPLCPLPQGYEPKFTGLCHCGV